MTLNYSENTLSLDFTLPDTVADVTYSAFLDFRKPIETLVQKEVQAQEKERKKDTPKELTIQNFREFADQQGEQAPTDPETTDEQTYLLNSFKYFCLLIEMNAHLERADILETLHRSLSAIIPEKQNLAKIPIHNPNDKPVEMLQDGVDWFDGEEITLTRLLCHLCAMFRNYIAAVPLPGQTFSVQYKGETYFVEPDRVQRVYEGQGKTYSTDEVFELTETRRIFEAKIEMVGDPDGALEFQMDLVLLAILLRKEGETLPVDRNERRRWIDARSQHFKGLKMDTVYRVQAFFLATLYRVVQSRISQLISAKRPNFQNTPLAATGKRTATPNATLRKSEN